MAWLSRSQILRRLYYRLAIYWRNRSGVDPEPLFTCWRQQHLVWSKPWQEQDFLVLDLEMSSLDSQQGEILSAGWVEIRQGCVRMNTAEHWLVAAEGSVGQSATVHLIRDCELVAGIAVAELLNTLLAKAAGKVLVFHHARLDMEYLNQLCRRVYSVPLLLPYVDTMAQEKQRLMRQVGAIQAGQLTLANCRNRYGLPDYPAHNALVDALATGELLLAQIARRGRGLRVGDLLE